MPAPAQPTLQHRVNRFEAQLICDAPAANVGDVRQTIAALSILRKTFYEKLKWREIDINRFGRTR